jgi:L-cysteine S-thiosulfotransferase
MPMPGLTPSRAKHSASLVVAALLTTGAGDVANGRAIVLNRQVAACLLCHTGPFPDPHLQGNLAPSLAGVGARMTADALRQRLIAPPPGSIMPSYAATTGLTRVGEAWSGKPILTPAQIEDVVAFLTTLTAP